MPLVGVGLKVVEEVIVSSGCGIPKLRSTQYEFLYMILHSDPSDGFYISSSAQADKYHSPLAYDKSFFVEMSASLAMELQESPLIGTCHPEQSLMVSADAVQGESTRYANVNEQSAEMRATSLRK